MNSHDVTFYWVELHTPYFCPGDKRRQLLQSWSLLDNLLTNQLTVSQVEVPWTGQLRQRIF